MSDLLIRPALDAYLVATNEEREADGHWQVTPCVVPPTGSTDKDGYRMRGLNGRTWRAHRLVWTIAHGAIPDGLYVLHRCDNRECVNVFHLFLGTAADNLADCISKGRFPSGDSHSSRTHPESRPRGEGHYRAKLTEEDVRAIRAAYREGAATRAQARQYGVHQQTIIHIIKGLSWKHVS